MKFKKPAIFMRTTALALFLILILPVIFGVTAQAAPSVASVTVSTMSNGETVNSKVYTDANQINLLLGLIPPEDKQAAANRKIDSASGGSSAALTFTRNGAKEKWIFYHDLCVKESSNPERSRVSSTETYKLLMQLSGYDPVEAFFSNRSPIYYKGEVVKSLYSHEGRNYSYQPLIDLERLVPLLEKRPPDTSRKTANLGFLLFTEKDKYTWSFTYENIYSVPPMGADGSPQRRAWTKAIGDTTKLDMLSALYNEALWGRYAQWLVFMSEEKIESIIYSGLSGAGYSNSSQSDAKEYAVSLNTESGESIHKIASFLKTMEVSADPEIHSGPDTPATSTGLSGMQIKFKTGTSYILYIHDRNVSVYSSELDGTVVYDASIQQINALRDFMALLPEARLARLK